MCMKVYRSPTGRNLLSLSCPPVSSQWTQDRVLALAPDSASASAGQGLASRSKWSSLGQSDRAVWGLCQGSGKSPYQTRVDLSEPAFKCSCPSRKFPCKHGIGLMLMFAKDAKAFASASEPGWVTDWLASRVERSEKKAERAEKAASGEPPSDPEAAAKRAAQRTARVSDGIAECQVWLHDLIRRGFADAQREDTKFWDRAASRMVDAQAPGLASSIRRLHAATVSGEGWQVRAADQIGRLAMLLSAGMRLDSLTPEFALDVRAALGFTQSKDEALAQPGLADTWLVAGQIIEEEDRLRARRSWLFGEKSGRRALVLDYAAGPAPLDPSIVAGTKFEGEVCFYPGSLGVRAIVKTKSALSPVGIPKSGAFDPSVETFLRGFASSLAKQPWLNTWPLLLHARLARLGDRWCVRDDAGDTLPIAPTYPAIWSLASIAADEPVWLSAEWNGEFLIPLAVLGKEFDQLFHRWAA